MAVALEIVSRLENSKPDYWVIHTFSNGGGYMYLCLRRLLEGSHPSRRSLLEGCAGVIFDSMPSLNPSPFASVFFACTASQVDR
mmetsp:Transcript_5662/g.10393  ORF Transcript_5662/g.10393 Transcript_5662/m.10393 type:complete len:84 (-) Transcript_5662:132-383(-)